MVICLCYGTTNLMIVRCTKINLLLIEGIMVNDQTLKLSKKFKSQYIIPLIFTFKLVF